MEYNSKADFISSSAVLIAERIGIWNSREKKINTPVWVKNKMLVNERQGRNLSWIDKTLAMRKHMLMEYPGATRDEVYYWIEKAEDILYRFNQRSIDGFIRKSIDPRLPTT
jgi:hypothetical protein